jgi:peptide/nickel transport system permease protein
MMMNLGSAHPLLSLFLRRLLSSIPTIIAIALLNFILLRLAPGDLVDTMASQAGFVTPEYMAELRSQFGLDQPLHMQLFHFLRRLATFDLGFSYLYNQPVSTLLMERAWATLLLMAASIGAAVSAGIVLGAIASARVGSWWDALISIAALLLYAMPSFWVGLMLIVLMSVKLGWLPIAGIMTIGSSGNILTMSLDVARHLVMPAIALALFYTAIYTRLVRASMLEVYGLDFIRTARAKGVRPLRLVRRHVLRNALLPVVTMVGMQVGTVLGGTVVIESVFSWPGLGQLSFDAITQRDFNLMGAILFLSSIVVVIVNISVDILYRILDPRIGASDA